MMLIPTLLQVQEITARREGEEPENLAGTGTSVHKDERRSVLKRNKEQLADMVTRMRLELKEASLIGLGARKDMGRNILTQTIIDLGKGPF